MILKRFYDDQLAQASYLIGCGSSGDAIVIDPTREIDQYIDAAAREKVRIAFVSETHIHADFVSGTRELAARTGATMCLSDEGGPDWRYGFRDDPNVRLLHDADIIEVGNIRLKISHTPGHTPEHITFFVTDGAVADVPIGAVTGDFVFVGDVGRPDLLEKAAKVVGTMDGAARQLFKSLQSFKQQPDWLQIWPGHGAGSACGKGLSAIPHSTVGYERMFNWAFAIDSEDEFVAAVLAGQPEPPKYFAEMKRINRDGPRVLGTLPAPMPLSADDLNAALQRGAAVIDTRRASDFAAGHIPGTINIPLDRSFATWAGWLVSYDAPFYLILQNTSTETIHEAVSTLARIGLDDLAGVFDAALIASHRNDLQSIPQLHAQEVAQKLENGEVTVLDVRGRAEWEAGHLPGVANIPLGYLTDRLAEIPRDKPIVLQCLSGGRSSIAASVLQAHGITDVSNLIGGFTAWRKEGLNVESGESVEALA